MGVVHTAAEVLRDVLIILEDAGEWEAAEAVRYAIRDLQASTISPLPKGGDAP